MKHLLFAIVILGLVSSAFAGDGKKHLFILSGQSNMAGHRPDEAFIPAVEKAFGKENVIVIRWVGNLSNVGIRTGKILRVPLPKQRVIFMTGS